jgi:glycogen(starch) synthase
MRISLLTSEYPPGERLGGIATHTHTMARALVRAGHDVQVVTPGSPGTVREEGVAVTRVEAQRSLHPVANRFVTNRRLAKAVLSWRPDVVHAAEFDANAWWLARFARVPIVTRLATPTGMVVDINGKRWVPHTYLLDFLERDQTRRSAFVYAPTRAIALRVGANWAIAPELIQVIPNSLDLQAVRAAGATAPARRLPARFIVFSGRLETRKGIGPFGQALPAVLATHPDLHVVLIGREDPEGAAAIAQFKKDVQAVAQRVHLLGALPRDQTLAIVARAELAVVPSLWESFGFVVVEAMALGVPVIGSECGGIPECIEGGRSGWLVPPGDADALRRELLTRLADRDGLERARVEARERSRRFDVDDIAIRVAGLLERACAAGGRPRAVTGAIYNNGYRRHFRPDDSSTPFHRLYDAKRQAVAAELARASRLRILDVGGGYGRITGPFAERHDVTLVDISREMLAEAKARFPVLHVIEANARALPFEDGAFDLVIALDLLCHLPDLREGTRELRRVTHAGGRVVCDTTNANPLWVLAYPSYVRYRPDRLVATMWHGGVLPEWRRIVRHHRTGEMRSALAAAGLDLDHVESFGPPGIPKWRLWWCRRIQTEAP